MSTSTEEAQAGLRGFSRRFAQFSIPGITEPRIVSGIDIPIVPLNAPVATNPGQDLQGAQTDRQRQQRLRRIARRQENELSESEIELVEFNLFTTEEIDAYAEVNITSSDEDGENSVKDLRMGPHGEGAECATCSSDVKGCPGHYGKLVLPRIMHPLAVSTIALVLSCICKDCSRLLVTATDIEAAGISRLRDTRRLEAIRDLIKRIEKAQKSKTIFRQCQHGVIGHGGISCESNPIYSRIRKDKRDYRLGMYQKIGQDYNLRGYLTPDLIYQKLDAIPPEDAQLLGFTDSHPRTMIIDRLIVIPYCARPDLYQGGLYHPDDLTIMYRAIVRDIIKYHNTANLSEREFVHANIYRLVGHLMKNDSKFNQKDLKISTDIRKRLQGKSGIIRGNLMGKRVNFAGRTVVGPGHYLRVDEIGIPRLMAIKLTRPIKVFENNRAEMQAKYDSGRVRHITMQTSTNAGSRLMIGDWFRQKYPDYQVQIGDVLECILEDGDLVLVNRQPTLHKQNILALYARIIDDRIVRINLSITTPLNADFDGDEVNIHVPQTIEAYAEAEQLLGVYRNLMSSQTNKPMIGIVYDTLSGAYLLTYPEEEIERLERVINKLNERQPQIAAEIELAQRRLAGVLPETEERRDLTNKLRKLREEFQGIPVTIEQYQNRQIVLTQRVEIDPVVFNLAIENVLDTPQYATLQERLNKYGVNPHGGRALISSTFPEDFDYSAGNPDDGKRVIIKNGILISGVLTKDTLGNKDGSIIGEMVKQQGGEITVDFMSDIQFVVRDYLQQRGLSVGISDCIPEDPEFRQHLDEALLNAKLKVIALSGKPSNIIMAEQQERKIGEALDIAKNEGDKIVQKFFKPDNAILIMANSGAKGTVFNAVQMSSALGQQKVSGKRIQANLAGNRALPSIEPGSNDPTDRGFCVNSFGSGLEPKEFFFHAQGGREGLTDTAVNTAQTGFLQHQIIKSAEDIHISPDGSVRSSDNAIVQFIYGDDGMDASELGTVKVQGENVPLFRNFQQLADKINRKYAPQV